MSLCQKPCDCEETISHYELRHPRCFECNVHQCYRPGVGIYCSLCVNYYCSKCAIYNVYDNIRENMTICNQHDEYKKCFVCHTSIVEDMDLQEKVLCNVCKVESYAHGTCLYSCKRVNCTNLTCEDCLEVFNFHCSDNCKTYTDSIQEQHELFIHDIEFAYGFDPYKELYVKNPLILILENQRALRRQAKLEEILKEKLGILVIPEESIECIAYIYDNITLMDMDLKSIAQHKYINEYTDFGERFFKYFGEMFNFHNIHHIRERCFCIYKWKYETPATYPWKTHQLWVKVRCVCRMFIHYRKFVKKYYQPPNGKGFLAAKNEFYTQIK